MNLNEIILVASILTFAFILIYLQNKSMQPKDESIGTIKSIKKVKDGLLINGQLNELGKEIFKKEISKTELYEITPVLVSAKAKAGSPEHKAKLSARAKERWAKPEYKSKMKKAFKNRVRDTKGKFKKVKK